MRELGADILVSVGGGSPIDSAKAIAYQIHEQTGTWIPSIAIPTTLSVAETTQNAGFTTEEQKKIAVSDPELVPKGISHPQYRTWGHVDTFSCHLRLRNHLAHTLEAVDKYRSR